MNIEVVFALIIVLFIVERLAPECEIPTRTDGLDISAERVLLDYFITARVNMICEQISITIKRSNNHIERLAEVW